MPRRPPLVTLTVVLVTYNSAAHLRPTLEALFAQRYARFEAILVDNASTDDSLAIAREFAPRGLRIIASRENLGFCGGNNVGAAAGTGAIVLLLNPDAILPPDGLRRFVQAFRAHPRTGAVGGKFITADRTTLLHCGGHVGFPAHCTAYGRGEPDEGQCDEPRRVDYVTGAALATPRRLWERLGGLDEDYFPAYYEDTDYCARVRRAGYAVWYWPIPIVHEENVSTEYKSPAFLRMHHGNRMRYMVKNLGVGALLFRALPAEAAWLWSWHSKGARRVCARLLPGVAWLFIKRRLLRLPPPHRGERTIGLHHADPPRKGR